MKEHDSFAAVACVIFSPGLLLKLIQYSHQDEAVVLQL